MPKATKKKKEKAADFSKAKLKLGKGKQLPTNQVDTSFKARSIALPTQSIAVENDASAPTTKRRLTFADLLAHLKHHNSGVKKDALSGLRELFDAHPELVESSLTQLVSACVRLIGDEDANVRRALLSFFIWLFPRIPIKNLAPHSSMLLLFTTSAQTHIFPEIQIDAVRFLDVYLDIIPDVVVSGWRGERSGHGKRVLDGYLSILCTGTKFGEGADTGPPVATSTASVMLSTASKLVVLKSLSKFLHAALNSTSNGNENYASTSSGPTWCFSSAFADPAAYSAFDSQFRPTTRLPSDAKPPLRLWQPEVDPEDDTEHFVVDLKSVEFENADLSYTLKDLSDAISSLAHNDSLQASSQLSDLHGNYEARLARTLHPVLLSNILDSSPSVFNPGSTPLPTDLGIVSAATNIYHSLYKALLTRADSNSNVILDNLQQVLDRMSPHFPFRPNPLARREIQVEQAFQELNVVFCELTSLLILSQTTQQATSRKHSVKAIQTQISQVKDFVTQLLRGVPSSSQLVGRPIAAQEYTALLPTLWMLLNSDSTDDSVDEDHDVLGAVLDHALRVSSAAAAKRPTINFLVRLVLLDTTPRYGGTFKVGQNAGSLQKFEQWLVHLPKVVWELGDTNVPCVEVVLRFLLRLFQRRSPLARADVATQLCARLVPYFTIVHPVRGALPGPFAKLDDPILRRLALDAAVSISACAPADTRGPLDASVRQAVEGSDQAAYWTEVTGSVLRSR
ncbi:hypothetical protein BC834DRAFT_921576 [Gloeopeniophorella convolvens]|nr:hypothetical protein BC834DRAFT_921576 [Gloeopeniophorella convolvens]